MKSLLDALKFGLTAMGSILASFVAFGLVYFLFTSLRSGYKWVVAWASAFSPMVVYGVFVFEGWAGRHGVGILRPVFIVALILNLFVLFDLVVTPDWKGKLDDRKTEMGFLFFFVVVNSMFLASAFVAKDLSKHSESGIFYLIVSGYMWIYSSDAGHRWFLEWKDERRRKPPASENAENDKLSSD